jgi:hypothetical protein
MAWIQDRSRALDIPVIDVLGAFRSLPRGDLEGMFIPRGQLDYPGAAGHLTARGNEAAARAIYDGLVRDPRLASALGLR